MENQSMDQYTDYQLQMLNYKLASENNALLRVLLEQQLRILEKLDIDHDQVASGAVSSVLPNPLPSSSDSTDIAELERAIFNAAHQTSLLMASEIRKRNWEWVQLNGQEPTE